ncbi:MAG: hypothetical protein L0241_20535 [Planctomycetia bacterium]|nr:hypothetical protein [Planctomycetia bacterium]
MAQAIVREGVATGLRELHLINTRLSADRLENLLDTPSASDFESLSFGGDRIAAPEKFRVLSRAPRLAGLRALDMSGDSPNDAGLEAFVSSPMVATLQKLDLSDCSLNRERTQLLATSAFGELRVLRLNRNSVGNDGAAAIARSPHLVRLLGLDLSYSQVGDEGVEAILESPLADGLVLLNLTGSPASDEMKEVLKARMGDRVRI